MVESEARRILTRHLVRPKTRFWRPRAASLQGAICGLHLKKANQPSSQWRSQVYHAGGPYHESCSTPYSGRSRSACTPGALRNAQSGSITDLNQNWKHDTLRCSQARQKWKHDPLEPGTSSIRKALERDPGKPMLHAPDKHARPTDHLTHE